MERPRVQGVEANPGRHGVQSPSQAWGFFLRMISRLPPLARALAELCHWTSNFSAPSALPVLCTFVLLLLRSLQKAAVQAAS